MASRGLLVAAGAAAVAAAGSLAGLGCGGGDARTGAAAIAAGTGLLGAAGVVASSRLRAAAALAAVALGASLVAVRIGAGLLLAPPGPAAAAVPVAAGEWLARVESSRQLRGGQSAVFAGGALDLRCAATLPAEERLIPGDVITWAGRFRPLPDGGYGTYLRTQGIDAICEVERLRVIAADGSPPALLERLRQASGDALERVLPAPSAGLAAGILVGLRDRVERDLAADFTTAGVSHIVAISGWNIAVVAGAMAAILRRTTRRRRAAAMLVAIALYTVFAGASPSVVRAAVMAAVVLLAAETGRAARASLALGWAIALMLVADPRAVADVGLQLSAAATAGLVAWGTPLARWLEARAPHVPDAIRESLAVSLAAQAATLPIILLAFGRLSLVAPFVNLVAVPLVPPVMAAGAVAFVAGWLVQLGAPGWLGTTLALPAWLSLQALIAVVRAAAALPFASASLAPPASLVAAATAAAGAIGLHAWLGASRRSPAAPRSVHPGKGSGPAARRRWDAASLRIALIVILVASLAGCVLVSRLQTAAEIVVLDVGQGDAILVQSAEGGRILVDGGPDGQRLLVALDAVIPPWDRRLDAVVLTHPHDDHAEGLVALFGRYRFDRAFESGGGAGGTGYRAWLGALAAAGMRPERLATGDELALGSIRLAVLWPDPGAVSAEGATDGRLDPADSANRRTNDASVVLLGRLPNAAFLLTGDAEDDVDPILVGRGIPHVDLLKVAHHGSPTATSSKLIEAIAPEIAVISVGRENTYGHPSPATIGRLVAGGARVLRSDESGAVHVRLGDGAMTVTSDGPRESARGRGSMEVVAGRGGTKPPTARRPDRRVALARAPLDVNRLLYDSPDVSPEPARGRVVARFARSARVAPAALTCRRRGRGLAGDADRGRRRSGRSPPRGDRGPAP